jgi:putative DeoR family transcriptional regulator, stage III sporulation protein D
LKGYIEERAVEIANYIIDNNATVRQTAKQFGISKSTVHKAVTKVNEIVRKEENSWRNQRMIRTLW